MPAAAWRAAGRGHSLRTAPSIHAAGRAAARRCSPALRTCRSSTVPGRCRWRWAGRWRPPARPPAWHCWRPSSSRGRRSVARSAPRISGSRRSGTPSASATASRVRSSSVGPRPPLKITISERNSACWAAGDQMPQIVAHYGLEHYFDAQLVELFGEIERVGVHAEGSQQLGANGDDLRVHG